MGVGYSLICHDCRTTYGLGYGSYLTWILPFDDVTVAGFDAKAITVRERCIAQKNFAGGDPATLRKNINSRQVLADHAGHRLEWWNHDYAWLNDAGDLEGEGGDGSYVIAPGVGAYIDIDLDPEGA